jgi:hypothetical protein
LNDSVKVAALAAGAHMFGGRCQGGGQGYHQAFLALDELQNRAAGRTRAKAGKLGKKLDQPVDLTAVALIISIFRQGIILLYQYVVGLC